MRLSIIIPALDEAVCIRSTLEPLQRLRRQGHEVILVDGGSVDTTREISAPLVDLILTGERGRARQMNAGAARASGDLLLFLHADTLVPAALPDILQQLCNGGSCWGRFDVSLSGRDILFRVIENLINIRSRLSGIATGDQAIFVSRDLFEQVSGYREIPLMEDIELSQRLKGYGAPICISERVITSSRRWEERGILATVFKMWILRSRFAMGADPAELARDYE